jgi:hypothetical protein
LATKMDWLLKLGVAALITLAAGGAGYYYGVYVPAREARMAHKRQLEQERVDAAARAAVAQLLAEQKASQQRVAAAQAAAQDRYQACLAGASAGHDAAWAAACQRRADQAQTERADCLANDQLPRTYCDSSYPPRDASSHCTLPADISSPLDADLASARDRCLQESKATVQ